MHMNAVPCSAATSVCQLGAVLMPILQVQTLKSIAGFLSSMRTKAPAGHGVDLRVCIACESPPNTTLL